MKRSLPLLSGVLVWLLCAVPATSAVRYVNVNNASPTPPYTSWETAATVIQDAIDVADAGDEIVVTDGVYQTGGRAVVGPGEPAPVSRVAVTKPLTVRSVNGPGVTVIRGHQVPGTKNGDGAVRCVYLANGATLAGFTLTNGATRSSGDWLSEQTGGGVWCESATAVVSDCVIKDSSAEEFGGGAYGGTLNNCTLTGSSAHNGGGAWGSALNNCTLTGNSSSGAIWCTLNNCTLSANSGDGASYSTLDNCTLSANSGDGAFGGTLNNCTLSGNKGWGARGAILNNCTITGNSSGGVSGAFFNWEWNCCPETPSILNNCLLYYNKGANYSGSDILNYCCTTPLPANGVGNITAEPQLASASHISATSPCRGAGDPTSTGGTDIDGEPWSVPPSIGCDEVYPGNETGPLTVAVQADFTHVAVGFPVNLTAEIVGNVSASEWDFGDGTVLNNRPYGTHAWLVPRDYPVLIRAYNQSHPDGVSATVTVRVVGQKTVSYVAANNSNPVPPYDSWATAANNVQDAVDAAATGTLVLVNDGVYQTGGRVVSGALMNRVAVTKPLTVRSVNGPGVTVIRGHQVPSSTNGDGAVRCVYLTSGAELTGFTLTNGATRSSVDWNWFLNRVGGGVCCESATAVVSNCVIKDNSAYESGGGAYGGTLNNCTLNGNSAQYGGGASGGALNNCTLTGNSAGDEGGGAIGGALNNCIVYFNTAPNGANYLEASGYGSSRLNYCCTTPLPASGIGNITAEPQLASASHISAASPCRGAGSPASTSGTDIDGEPWSVPPSIGCDEVYPGNETGPLTVAVQADFTHVAVGFPVNLTAEIAGNVSASVWDFGDGNGLSNRPYATHSWLVPGDYAVTVRAFNRSHPDGVSATVTVRVVGQEPVSYVAANSSNPVPPYDSWATAANNVQDAVDAAAPGTVVLVNDGVYQTGGRVVWEALMSRVAVTKPLTVRSVNGPGVTVIRGHQVPGTTNGDGAVRCVYLGNGARLSGFTLTNGATAQIHWQWDSFPDKHGGGVFCESATAVVSNCVIKGNSAEEQGGGASGGTLDNCTLTDNSAQHGGGAFDATLNNCTLTGNSAGVEGGGAWRSALNNCIVYFNTAPSGANFYVDLPVNLPDGWGGRLNYCCTTPLPPIGIGNITNAPLFVDAAADDFRLQANSPCINAGLNANAPAGPDLDGNPRIVGGRVDIGAYEFQLPPPLSFAGWATGFGLSGAAAGAGADADGDRLPNSVEYILGTSPSASGASGSPAVTVSSGSMVFTFTRDDASEAPGVALAVETSADLVTWPAVFNIGPNVALSTPGVRISENGTAPDTISVAIPQGTGGRRFARLKVIIAP